MSGASGSSNMADNPGFVAARAALASSYSSIRERPGGPRRKLRRRGGATSAGVSVVEKPGYVPQAPAAGAAAGRGSRRPREGGEEGDGQARHSYVRLTKACRAAAGEQDAEKAEDEDEIAALAKVPEGFGESFWRSPALARPLPAVLAHAAAGGAPEGVPPAKSVGPEDIDLSGWFGLMQLGFSLLVQGVGSKREVLEAFAEKSLKEWGHVVHIAGFHASLSLAECLRGVLEKLYPNATRTGNHNSLDALVNSLRAARRTEQHPRPLCFVVHNLESLPAAHQAALSNLAATQGFHFVVSVDSIWAPLMLSPHHLKNFNFCREEVHTFKSYAVEHAARYPSGPPAWSDPAAERQRAPKASLGLVLRSLTRCHKELVQVIAEHQIGVHGRGGISNSKLLEKTTDRMIASTSNKLRSLLNELKDHEVVTQRSAADGGILLYLTCDAKVLQRLAQGQEADESDEESDHEEAE